MNVSRPDINSVLMQMRDMQAQMQQTQQTQDVMKPGGLNPMQQTGQTNEVPGFGELLKDAVDTVNNNQMRSSEMAKAYERGEPGVDLTEVMINAQKASLSFQAMTQVRNRLVSAYQDIMNMPI